MGMTNGTTQVVNLALELVALESECHRETGAILATADEAEREDLANDPVLMQALKDLERALEMDAGKDRDASLLQCKAHLQQAISMDLSEMSIARLRAKVMPYHKNLEALEDQTRKVIGDLQKIKQRRAA